MIRKSKIKNNAKWKERIIRGEIENDRITRLIQNEWVHKSM